MFAITEGTRKVFGTEITTYTRDVVSANLLEVEAGTNGFQGGDAGHGSRAYIRIENMGGTAIQVNALGHDGGDGPAAGAVYHQVPHRLLYAGQTEVECRSRPQHPYQ